MDWLSRYLHANVYSEGVNQRARRGRGRPQHADHRTSFPLQHQAQESKSYTWLPRKPCRGLQASGVSDGSPQSIGRSISFGILPLSSSLVVARSTRYLLPLSISSCEASPRARHEIANRSMRQPLTCQHRVSFNHQARRCCPGSSPARHGRWRCSPAAK